MKRIDEMLDSRPGNAGEETIDSMLDRNRPKSSLLRRGADYLVTGLKGAVGVPEAAVGIADILTGGQAGKLAEDIGFRPKEAKSIIDQWYSPEQQAANKAVQEAQGFVPTLTAALQNPSTIAHSVVESAPSILAGGAVARGATLIPRVTPVLASAIGEGAVSAGQTAEQIRQESKDGTLTPTQAAIAAGSGALTGALTGVGGAVAKKLGISDIDTLVAGGKAASGSSKGLARRAAEGFVSEGILEELPQSLQEQAAQNIAQGKPWDEGLGNAAAMGMLAGGVMGIGGGLIHGKHAAETPPPPTQPAPAPSEMPPSSAPPAGSEGGQPPSAPDQKQGKAQSYSGETPEEAAKLANFVAGLDSRGKSYDLDTAQQNALIGREKGLDLRVVPTESGKYTQIPARWLSEARQNAYADLQPAAKEKRRPEPAAPLALPGPDTPLPGQFVANPDGTVRQATMGDRMDSALRVKQAEAEHQARQAAAVESGLTADVQRAIAARANTVHAVNVQTGHTVEIDKTAGPISAAAGTAIEAGASPTHATPKTILANPEITLPPAAPEQAQQPAIPSIPIKEDMSHGKSQKAGQAAQEVLKAEQAPATPQPAPAEDRAYPKDRATLLAKRMTAQGLPSRAVAHPTQPGMYSIESGEAQKESPQPPAGSERKPAETFRPERRKDAGQRKTVDQMSPEDMRRELLTNHLTGIANKRAYDESKKLPVQVSIDADSLKWVNDTLGHASGDEMLRAIAQALAAETPNAYHVSGDEFIVQALNVAGAELVMKRAADSLTRAKVSVSKPDGTEITLNGLGFSYGTGSTLEEAETGLQAHKAARTQSGERAARGENPPGAVFRTRNRQGLQDNQDHPAGQVTSPEKLTAVPEKLANPPETAANPPEKLTAVPRKPGNVPGLPGRAKALRDRGVQPEQIKQAVKEFAAGDPTLLEDLERINAPETAATSPSSPGKQEVTAEPKHVENGLSETATTPVIADSLKKGARSSTLTPKQQQAHLLALIDAAIKDAPSAKEQGVWDRKANRIDMKKINGKATTVSFDVPGDGRFKVLNFKERLEDFRKKVSASAGFKNSEPKRGKYSPGDTGPATIRDMLDDGDLTAARELANVRNEPFAFGRNVQPEGHPLVYLSAKYHEHRGVKFFVGHVWNEWEIGKTGAWSAIELRTGLNLGSGRTPELALSKATKNIDDRFSEMEKKVQEIGLTSQDELARKWDAWAAKKEAELSGRAEARLMQENAPNQTDTVLGAMESQKIYIINGRATENKSLGKRIALQNDIPGFITAPTKLVATTPGSMDFAVLAFDSGKFAVEYRPQWGMKVKPFHIVGTNPEELLARAESRVSRAERSKTAAEKKKFDNSLIGRLTNEYGDVFHSFHSARSKSEYIVYEPTGIKIRISDHDLPLAYEQPNVDLRLGQPVESMLEEIRQEIEGIATPATSSAVEAGTPQSGMQERSVRVDESGSTEPAQDSEGGRSLKGLIPERGVRLLGDGYKVLLPSDLVKFERDNPVTPATDTGLPSADAAGTATQRMDGLLLSLVAQGKPTSEILAAIAKGSRNPFYRLVASRLSAIGTDAAISMGSASGLNFAVKGISAEKFAASYRPKSNTVTIHKPRDLERNLIHELMHAATYRALRGKSLAAAQMKGLFEHVKADGRLNRLYGMSNVDEFVAEAFSNPQFQQALRLAKAPRQVGTIRSAWDSFVNLVRRILGLNERFHDALSEALSIGARLMGEGRVGIENEALGSIAGQSGLDEGERQIGEVRRRYEGSMQWMKAPNGQPTRLNERQWLQVRTESFKHWFGDWESAANRDYLRASTTARVTGAEIGVGFDKEPVSMANMRRAAKKWARENLVGKYRNARSGLRLEVRPAGIDRAIGHGGAADKLRAFAAIPDVLRDGVVVFDGENPKHQRSRLVVVAGKVAIRGTEFYISAGFREDANGRLFYDHELLEMERAERLSSQWGAAQLSKHPLPSAHLNDYTASFLGQAFAASKVTDANGEPQVVYHGTNADFDEFSPSGEFGIWLAERQDKASAYSSPNGGLIMPLFAAIRNPMSWADVKNAREMVGPLANPGGIDHKERALERQSRVRSRLGSMGFDGFHDGPVWSAFHPGQIKSATGNTGAFSAFDDSVLGNLASTDDLRTRANNLTSDLLTSAESFNWLNRTINTQYHKAQKDPAHFGRVFEMGQKFIETISRAASRPADLAPTLLPKLENARAALKGLFGGTKTNAALNGLAPAVFSDDLRDPNAHVWSDAELREKFKLTDEQIGLYREFRRAVDASLDEVAAAEAWKSLRRYVPATQRDVAKERVLSAPGNAREALHAIVDQAIQAEPSEEIRATIAGQHGFIDDTFNRADELKRAGYAPRMRFGRYTVTAVDLDSNGRPEMDESGEPKPPRYFGMFESEREANAMARRLRSTFGAEPVSIVSGVASEQQFKLYRGISPETVGMFANVLAKHANPEQRDQLRKTYDAWRALAFNNHSTIKRMIERKGIAGFGEDVPRVLASFLTSNARRAASAYHADDISETVDAIPKEKGDVKDEAIRLSDAVLNPEGRAPGVRNFLFFQYLGGSIAAAAVNMTQPIMMTLPYLAQYVGARKATTLLASAARQMFKVDNLALASALRQASQEGIVEPQEIHYLYAQSIGGGMISKLPGAMAHRAQSFLKLWGTPFAIAEKINRRMTFIAAWNAAIERNEADPFAFAKRAVEETQGVYNAGNANNLSRTAIGSVAMTFRQYSIAYLEMLTRMWQAGPEGKKAALLALAIMALAGGAGGMPFADDLDDLIDTLGQAFGYDTNAKRWKEKMAAEVLGKEVSPLILHGLSPYLPIDIQGRLGMGNLLPATSILKKSENAKDAQLLEILGPVGGVAQSYLQGAEAALSGDYLKALRAAVMPKALQDLAKGADMMETGMYRDTRGRKVIETGPGAAFSKAIGFQPSEVAEVQRGTRIVQQDIALQKKTAMEISDQRAQAILEKDPELAARANRQLQKWNADNPEMPISISPQQIMGRVKAALLTKEERMVKTAPPAMRARVFNELQR